MADYVEEKNKIEIKDDYDVIVVGGGVAGVSAAISAKRNGARTLLIEKSVMLGGLATLGLIAIYLPLCDGNGRKIIGGVAEEMLHMSIKYGYDNLPKHWIDGNESGERKRYQTVFSPPEFVVALDEAILDEQIDILFDTVSSNVNIANGVIEEIIVENKSGRQAYRGKMIIDATGDAEVMCRSGASCEVAENWLSYWAYSTDLDGMKKAVENQSVFDGIHLKWFGGEADGKNAIEKAKKYYGTDAQEVTKFIIDGRKLMKNQMSKENSNHASFLTMPGMPQFRTIRRIKGVYELTENDVNTHFEDSIGATGDWRKAGPVYEIPFRALIDPNIKNAITAGRIIAAAGDAWEVTRVIPTAALTGQAAGVAAAMAVNEGCHINEVRMDALQDKLTQEGVLIHF